MKWADRIMQLRVRVNADTPADAHRGRDFGAEGIGLCRTEHMFFDRRPARRHAGDDRRPGCAPAGSGRWPSCSPCSAATSRRIFRAMEGYPVTIRLLDPPLHEFLPKEPAEIEALASELKLDPATLQRHRGPAARGQPHARACAAAGWGSSIPRSPRCRCGRSSRPPAPWPPGRVG